MLGKNRSIVCIIKADDYNYFDVYEASKKCLELIGGFDRLIKHGDNVFVKKRDELRCLFPVAMAVAGD